MTHNFAISHKVAEQKEASEWYRVLLQTNIPGFRELKIIKKGHHLQAVGGDVIVVLGSGHHIMIDNKFRSFPSTKYSDILLETVADRAANAPGWVVKNLKCHYIGYWFSDQCGYLLDWQFLSAAWHFNGDSWTKRFNSIVSPNQDEKSGRRWDTINVPVPIRELEGAGVRCHLLR